MNEEQNNLTNNVEPTTPVQPVETPAAAPVPPMVETPAPVAAPVAAPVETPVVESAPAETPVVEPTPVVEAAPVEPVAPVTPEVNTPVAPVVNAAPEVAPAPEVKKKGMNPIILILLILALIGGTGYGLYTYTDIFTGNKNTSDNTVTTTTTTAVVKKAEEIDFEEEELYASKAYILDNNLYLVLNTDYATLLTGEDKDFDGTKAKLYKEKVSKLFVVPYSNGGLNEYIYVDTDGYAYTINLKVDSTVTPLDAVKNEKVSNVANVVSLNDVDGWAYEFVNTEGEIVGNETKIVYDFVNKNGNNKLTNGDLYVLTVDNMTPGEGTSYTVEFSVSLNGNKVPVELTKQFNSELVKYEDLQYVSFDINELS